MSFQKPDLFLGARTRQASPSDDLQRLQIPRISGRNSQSVVITGENFQAYIPCRRVAETKAQAEGKKVSECDFLHITYYESGEQRLQIPVLSENHRRAMLDQFRFLDKRASLDEIKDVIQYLTPDTQIPRMSLPARPSVGEKVLHNKAIRRKEPVEPASKVKEFKFGKHLMLRLSSGDRPTEIELQVTAFLYGQKTPETLKYSIDIEGAGRVLNVTHQLTRDQSEFQRVFSRSRFDALRQLLEDTLQQVG